MSVEANPTVLMLDDNRDALLTMKSAFEGLPMEVHSASTIGEAEALLEEKTFDLAILDFYLPDGTSAKLAEDIKAARSDAVIVMVTGVTEEEDVSQSVDVVADAYMEKPVKMDELIATVEDLLDKQKRSRTGA
jgi:DNA-binding response OmpR family regulator